MSAANLIPVENFTRRSVAPGDIIFLEGQPADVAYVILKGEVQVGAQGSAGTMVVVNRMHAGEIFGEMALLRADGRRTATTMSNEGCELLEVDRSFFDGSMAKADPLLRYVIERLCERLIALTTRAASQGFGEAI